MMMMMMMNIIMRLMMMIDGKFDTTRNPRDELSWVIACMSSCVRAPLSLLPVLNTVTYLNSYALSILVAK